MVEIVGELEVLLPFFPGSAEPILFPDTGGFLHHPVGTYLSSGTGAVCIRIRI